MENEIIIPERTEIIKISENAKIEDDIPKYLTKDEIYTILDIIPQNRLMHRTLIYTLWTTGIRITEATSLIKENIDFHSKTLKIIWLKRRKKKMRTIPIKDDLATQLALCTSNLTLRDRIFPITKQRAGQITKRYSKLANIEKRVSPHIFRHSFAVHFLLSGGSIVALQKLLGHAHITTTMRYLKIIQGDLRDQLNKVEF